MLAGEGRRAEWTSVSAHLFNFLMNGKALLLQIAHRGEWMGRQSGQRALIYLGGKEPKPAIKEGERMFCSSFVHAFLLCSELLTASTSLRQDTSHCTQLQGMQSDVLNTHGGCIQSSGLSGCRFSPFYCSLGGSKYPESTI